MPLHSAEYWDAKASQIERAARRIDGGMARAGLLAIAAECRKIAELTRELELESVDPNC